MGRPNQSSLRQPQHLIPLLVTAHVAPPPAEICVTPLKSSGTSNCPQVLSPQHRTPVRVIAHVCAPPAAICEENCGSSGGSGSHSGFPFGLVGALGLRGFSGLFGLGALLQSALDSMAPLKAKSHLRGLQAMEQRTPRSAKHFELSLRPWAHRVVVAVCLRRV